MTPFEKFALYFHEDLNAMETAVFDAVTFAITDLEPDERYGLVSEMRRLAALPVGARAAGLDQYGWTVSVDPPDDEGAFLTEIADMIENV